MSSRVFEILPERYTGFFDISGVHICEHTRCIMRSCVRNFVHWRWRTLEGGRIQGWGGSASLRRALVPGIGRYFCSWYMALFLTWGKIHAGCSVSMFSVSFYKGWECMWVYVCVYAQTARQVLGCEPRGRDETPGEPEQSRSTKALHTCNLAV